MEISRSTKRLYLQSFITPNAAIDKYFSPLCLAKSIDPGHFYGCLDRDVVCMEISVVSTALIRLEVLLEGKKSFSFPHVEYLFDRSTCRFTTKDDGEGKMTVDGKSSSVSIGKFLDVASRIINLGEMELEGKYLDKLIHINGVDLHWRAAPTMKLASNAAGYFASFIAVVLALIVASFS